MKKVLVIDTSILCVWLQIKHMDTCGPAHDRWDYPRVERHLSNAISQGHTLVLPLASLIETGNHIAQSNDPDRYQMAQKLGEVLVKAADETSPWGAFRDQSLLWTNEELHRIAQSWPTEAARKISIGDFTIAKVAEYYAKMNFAVEILSGDQGLKSMQPAAPALSRRRRADSVR